VKHAGILAHSTEGAALCFPAFCREGFRRVGNNEHPEVTLDYIAFAYSMPAWDAGDHARIRATLSVSADFFAPELTLALLLYNQGVADRARSGAPPRG
jgi:hypothetical protein